MAAAEILAVGNTAATSPDVVLTDNTGVTGPNARVWIDVKDETGAWNPASPLEVLTSQEPVRTFYATPSTIRFRRDAGATCGVFRAA